MQKSKIQIVWFKRDLRTTDHKPLFEASKTLKPILPIYVVENEYWKQPFSNKRHWCFIYDSLIELRKELKKLGQSLIVRIGSVTDILNELSNQFNIISIFSHEETGNQWTYDRDLKVKNWCNEKNISLIECAVGEKEDSLPLYLANPKNPGAHSLIKDTPQQKLQTDYLKVKVNTLDSLFGDLEIIHLIKIDIEGYELNALKGGLNTLKKVQNLLIEFSPHLCKDPYEEAKNFFNILSESGHKPNILEFESLKELNKSDINFILDFLKNRDLNDLPINKVQKDLIFTKA